MDLEIARSLDQFALGSIDRWMLGGVISKPYEEDKTPDDSKQSKRDKRPSPAKEQPSRQTS